MENPLSTFTSVSCHCMSVPSSPEWQRIIPDAPRAFLSPRTVLPFRWDFQSPFFNYRSLYFHRSTFNSCWTSSLTYPSTHAYFLGWFHSPLSQELMLVSAVPSLALLPFPSPPCPSSALGNPRARWLLNTSLQVAELILKWPHHTDGGGQPQWGLDPFHRWPWSSPLTR